MVKTGLDILRSNDDARSRVKGSIGYLCHGASIDQHLDHGIYILKEKFGERLKALFSPQHGLQGDTQDNMVETDHTQHAYFDLPVYSLYSETRKPTAEMLQGLDTLVIDLQDVGTRVYTYIYTMILTMEACGTQDIKVLVLDRPNPIGGIEVEGNILDPAFKSFVGMYPLPMRHGMTIGEIARLAQKFWGGNCDLEIIELNNWKRSMNFYDTHLPWVLPSPNLPTIETAFVYPGSVLFEGTSVSEGRGTTKSLEILGHPHLEPYGFIEHIKPIFEKASLTGFKLRPLYFIPTFHKYQNQACGGIQIHITDYQLYKPWKVGQILCRELYNWLGNHFSWKEPPYEYEYEKLPIDILNGTDKIRKWVEANRDIDTLIQLELASRDKFLEQRESVLLY